MILIELAWIPIDIHLREAPWSSCVSGDFPVTHVACSAIKVKQLAIPIGIWLNPAPESAMIDRLNVGLRGEYVKGPGGMINAGLDKLLCGE